MADGTILSGRSVSPIGYAAHTDANYTKIAEKTVPVAVDGYWLVTAYFWGGTSGGLKRSSGMVVGCISVDAGTAAVSTYVMAGEQLGDVSYDFKLAMSSGKVQLQGKTESGQKSFGWLEMRGGEVTITP